MSQSATPPSPRSHRRSNALAGTVDEMVEQLERQREDHGISAIGLSAEVVDEMAPVVALLAGNRPTNRTVRRVLR